MLFGISRRILRAANRQLIPSTLAFAAGNLFILAGAFSAYQGIVPLHQALPPGIAGLVLAIYSGYRHFRLVRWFRRATWVLRNVEPVPMHMTVHSVQSRALGRHAHVDLTPLGNNPPVGCFADIPVLINPGKRKYQYRGLQVTTATVYADIRTGGPIVIRTNERLMCAILEAPHYRWPILQGLYQANFIEAHRDRSTVSS